jgi:alkylation response protein AidB-like acyl-CoA dehydrogenase
VTIARGPLVADFELSPELVTFRDKVRAFAEQHLGDSRRFDAAVEFPRDPIAAAGELGLLRITTPEQYGGTAMGNLASCIMLEEINRKCPSTGVTISVHNSLACAFVAKWGTEEQKRRWLPKLITGEWIGAYCLSEACSGSDAAGLRCAARRDGDHYVLDGAKLWITSGQVAGLYITFVRTGEDRVKGISTIAVERGTPGFAIGKKERKLGVRGSPTNEIVFDNARVPASNLIGQEGQGFTMAMDGLDSGRLGIASQALGLARAAIELIAEHLKHQRDGKGRPAAAQADQWTLADLAAELEAYRLLVWRAAVLRDRNVRVGTEAAMAKLCASRLCNRAARAAVAILGQCAASGRSRAEQLLRDARVTEIYEGATDILRLVIARGLLA